MKIEDISTKLDEIENLLGRLESFDYSAKNITNQGGYIKDLKGNDMKVSYSTNSKSINGKTYDQFVKEIKDYFNDYIHTIKKDLKEVNDKRPLDTAFVKDWTPLKIPNKEFWYGSICEMPFVPSYYTVTFKLEGCQEKNGGTNGIIVEVPSIGPSTDGLPIDINDSSSVKNYSGHWYESGKIMLYLKKGPSDQWVGKCGTILYKVKAWR